MMLAVEKSTSQLFQKSHTTMLKSHRPEITTEALKVIANNATRISANASDTMKLLVVVRRR